MENLWGRRMCGCRRRGFNRGGGGGTCGVFVNKQNSRRMDQLDGLRAIAVIGVLMHHSMGWANQLQLGTLGVNLFFVLSGFLITGILLDARRKAEGEGYAQGKVLAAFYARRFLRIFPPYYAVLAVAIAIGMPAVRETAFWNLTYLSNWHQAGLSYMQGPPVAHLWTLAVEEQFYLMLPALVLFCPRKWLLPILGLAVLASPLVRLAIGSHWYGAEWRAAEPTFSNFDTLGMGALLAYGRRESAAISGWITRHGSNLLFAGLVMFPVAMACLLTHRGWRFQLVLLALSNGLIFGWVVDRAAMGFGGAVGRLLSWKPLRYIGTISYGIYLYHEFVGAQLTVFHEKGMTFIPTTGILRFIWVTGITIPLAAISWMLMEKPLNDLKRFFPYVPSGRSKDMAAERAAESAVPAAGPELAEAKA